VGRGGGTAVGTRDRGSVWVFYEGVCTVRLTAVRGRPRRTVVGGGWAWNFGSCDGLRLELGWVGGGGGPSAHGRVGGGGPEAARRWEEKRGKWM